MTEAQEYEQLKKLFESEYDFNKNYDDSYLEKAIRVFCAEAFLNADTVSAGANAARVIALHLMRSPDLRKEHLITFPSVFFDKDNMLTAAEKRRRLLAFETLIELRDLGGTIDAAMTAVAKRNNVSYEKVRQARHENKNLGALLNLQKESKK